MHFCLSKTSPCLPLSTQDQAGPASIVWTQLQSLPEPGWPSLGSEWGWGVRRPTSWVAWPWPTSEPPVQRKEDQDPDQTISKTLTAPKVCVSSHRCKHASCYIRAALHLSSHSHTPTNYPPETYKHTSKHTSWARAPAANSSTLAHAPHQPPTVPGSCSSLLFETVWDKYSFYRQRKFGTPSTLALTLPEI